MTSISARIPNKVYRSMSTLLIVDKINWCIFSVTQCTLAGLFSCSDMSVLDQTGRIFVISIMISVINGIIAIANSRGQPRELVYR